MNADRKVPPFMRRRVLVDMDGVIANWGKQWDIELEAMDLGPQFPRHAEQTSFNLKENLSDEDAAIVDEIMACEGFYAELEEIEGAFIALRQILRMGHDVRIVTSPWISNPTCASDKINWVRERLGEEWAKRVVITTDKTIVSGDVLIDDKPSITGSAVPTWEHILFDQPYNQGGTKRRILDWADWPTILEVLS